tara:strand:+ start:354 stop:674 length:321 start_codon:yes stop_codon:yes gene_type:complete
MNNQGDYNFKFLNILSDNLDINIYHDYLQYQDKYLLKNNWNHVVGNWKKIQKYLDKKKSLNGIYSENYNYIHKIISQGELDNLLCDFISGDKFKAVVVLLSISELI